MNALTSPANTPRLVLIRSRLIHNLSPGSMPTPYRGAGGNRTRDPLLAKQALYQLSYSPKKRGEGTVLSLESFGSPQSATYRTRTDDPLIDNQVL